MNSIDIKNIYNNINDFKNKDIEINGWIKNHRKQKEFGFIDFYDGTYFKPIQAVYDKSLINFDDIQSLRIGSAIKIKGMVKKSLGKEQDFEIEVKDIELLGDSEENFTIQTKHHTNEFLREVAHLRPRTNLFQAIFKIRSIASLAIHSYFQENGYLYFHAPLITANDGEGTGEMFQLTTLDMNNIPKKDGKIDYTNDFFGKRVGLTVTGQLEAETFAMAFKKVYTFGPTFRADKSNTKIHASEFWMIEPEIAFCDLDGLMNIEEEMLKYIVKYVLEKAKEELVFLDKFVENGLIDKLNSLVTSSFTRITHYEVINILKGAKVKWEFEPSYGEDIAKEHEKYLTDYFHGPVFVTNWPKEIKAFYMKQNDDNKTVAAVDLLVPGAGELMGGSQREEDYNKLYNRMKELKMNIDPFKWYLDLRRYGGCIHSGFGMGFERLLIYLTGVENIRDVIPYPRTFGNCEF